MIGDSKKQELLTSHRSPVTNHVPAGRPPGRIFCIGRNYAKHIAELGNAPDSGCLVFMKPPSCIVPAGREIRLPRERGAVHHEAELVVRMGHDGQIDALTLGLDLTLRDLQNELKAKGAPWELTKAFDDAAPLGAWQPLRSEHDLKALKFEFQVNGETRQRGNTADLLYPVEKLLKILSSSWALLPGDLIYTGTPEGVGPLLPGDQLRLFGAGLGDHHWHCSS